MQVALLDINETAGKSLTQTLEDQYGQGRALFLNCNVESEEMVKGNPLGAANSCSKIFISHQKRAKDI